MAVRTPSGAELTLLDDAVIKVHAPRTDPVALALRLRLAGRLAQFVPPLLPDVELRPDGRVVTVWPRVEVAAEDDPALPWAEAGALLAGLHRTAVMPGLPRHGWPDRVVRARSRAPAELAGLGAELERAIVRPEPDVLVHGDWHLGQLGRWDDGWRLLDIDDLGVGDPAWDLARPAGFWACGLLPDEDWRAFLDAYRVAGGPAVGGLVDGWADDPWPALELPARCAVFVAAVRASNSPDPHSQATASALVDACRRMAQ